MKKNIENFTMALIHSYTSYGIVNSMALNELGKIDSKISKRIRRKFMPKISEKENLSESEYFDTVIKKLGREILVKEEIHYEIHKMDMDNNMNFKTIFNFFIKINSLKEIQK